MRCECDDELGLDDIAQLLILRGADYTARDQKQRNLLDVARHHNHTNIIDMFGELIRSSNTSSGDVNTQLNISKAVNNNNNNNNNDMYN